MPAYRAADEMAKITGSEPHENRNYGTAARARFRHGATRVGTLQCSAKRRHVEQRTHNDLAFGQHLDWEPPVAVVITALYPLPGIAMHAI
jgi:hypothetical protein